MSDLVRLGAPDGRVAEVDGVTGRRYKATGGGMYEMHPADARAFKAEGAFVPSVGGPTIRGGYTCPGCGFKAVIRTCSRCGERGETDAERRARLTAQAEAANEVVVSFPPGAADEFIMMYAQRADGSLREIGPAHGTAFVPHESGLGGFEISATVIGRGA